MSFEIVSNKRLSCFYLASIRATPVRPRRTKRWAEILTQSGSEDLPEEEEEDGGGVNGGGGSGMVDQY